MSANAQRFAAPLPQQKKDDDFSVASLNDFRAAPNNSITKAHKTIALLQKEIEACEAATD